MEEANNWGNWSGGEDISDGDMEEANNWGNWSGGEDISDYEINFQDANDINDDDGYNAFEWGSLSKPQQFRSVVSKGKWNQEKLMTEIVEKKGKMWVYTGIVRGGTTYCFIEETLFLAEIGALQVVNDNGDSLTLKDLYEMVAKETNGCCFDLFKVYRKLKSLGYIVGRHAVQWILKSSENTTESHSSAEVDFIKFFSDMRINNKLVPFFDVYHPNGKFRKSAPGNPSFALCLTSGYPPSDAEIRELKKEYNKTPLKFCHGVNLFSFDKVDVDVLP